MTSNQPFDTLRTLVLSMRPPEKKLARNLLEAFHTNGTAKHSRALRLFELVRKRPEISFEAARKAIAPGAKARSFEKLVVRVCSKLTESLGLDINVKREGAYSSYYRNRLQVRKHLNEAEILHGRGLHRQALLLVEKSSASCLRHEQFELLLPCLEFRAQVLATELNVQDWKALQAQIADCKAALKVLSVAINYYQRYYMQLELTGNRQEPMDLLVEGLSAINKLEKGVQSVRLNYFKGLLRLEYLRAAGQYAECIAYSTNMLQEIDAHAHCFSPHMVASLHSDLASACLYAANYGLAQSYSTRAMAAFAAGSHNYLTAAQWHAWALLYLHDFAGVIEFAERLLPHMEEEHQQLAGRFAYLAAWASFLDGESSRAFMYLQETQLLDADKAGWNLGARFLTMMIYATSGLDDNLERLLHTTRTFMRNLQKQQPTAVRKRDRLIFEVLCYLMRESVNFKLTAHNMKKQLSALADYTQPGMRWEPCMQEAVPFEQWFMAAAQQTAIKLPQAAADHQVSEGKMSLSEG